MQTKLNQYFSIKICILVKKKVLKKKGITLLLSFLIRKIDGATLLTIAFFFSFSKRENIMFKHYIRLIKKLFFFFLHYIIIKKKVKQLF